MVFLMKRCGQLLKGGERVANLYQINKEIEDVLDAILNSVDEETGEVDESLTEVLANLQVQKNEKLESIGCYAKNIKGDIDAFKAEEKSLKKRRESKEKCLERLMKYVDSVLCGEEFETTKVSYKYTKSYTTEIDDLEKLVKYCKDADMIGDDKFVKETTSFTPNKDNIKKFIRNAEKEGKEVIVPGVHIEDKKTLKFK